MILSSSIFKQFTKNKNCIFSHLFRYHGNGRHLEPFHASCTTAHGSPEYSKSSIGALDFEKSPGQNVCGKKNNKNNNNKKKKLRWGCHKNNKNGAKTISLQTLFGRLKNIRQRPSFSYMYLMMLLSIHSFKIYKSTP